MAPNSSNSSNLEQLALTGLIKPKGNNCIYVFGNLAGKCLFAPLLEQFWGIIGKRVVRLSVRPSVTLVFHV